MSDIRNARFYVIDEDDGTNADAKPLSFEPAFDKANALAENGRRIKVLYTQEASQTEVTRFVNRGIQVELASGA